MYFQKPGRNSKYSKNLEEIQKTWRKFPKIFWPPCFNNKTKFDKFTDNKVNKKSSNKKKN